MQTSDAEPGSLSCVTWKETPGDKNYLKEKKWILDDKIYKQTVGERPINFFQVHLPLTTPTPNAGGGGLRLSVF